MTRLAIIPARGGSKRIPGKNIRPFHGKPIIFYSIEAALESRLFDRVVVSTDDPKIAELSSQAGANVPFMRPSEYADDFCGTNDVVTHALEWFKERGTNWELCCCIYPTAPMLEPRFLKEGLRRLVERSADFVISVSRFEYPVQRAVSRDNEGYIQALWPENVETRSQDLPEAFHDAGQFYWGKSEAFLSRAPMLTGNTLGVLIPRTHAQDIDTYEDWRFAEMLYSAIAG